MTDKTQFIWLYINDEARGDELRYSMRSVYKFFSGTPHITLVGDKPDWYHGHFINVPRIPVPHESIFHALYDQHHKLWVALQHAAVADEFVVMMDDHYFVKPVSMNKLRTPRITPGWAPKRRYWWDIATTRTMQILERYGLSTHLYETHLMHVFEKGKLLHIFDRFDLCNNALLRNTLYGNVFRSNPSHATPFIATPQSAQTARQLDVIARRSTVLNHASDCWNETMHKWLNNRLPNMVEVEVESIPVLVQEQVAID